MTRTQDFQAVAAEVANAQASRPKGGRRPAPPKPKVVHSISTVKPIRNHTPASRRQATPAARPVTKSRASACPNTACTEPDVQDGVCHSCGTIVTESNIVSEVTFGENAAGGAVLQGTFIGDGKTHANSMGPGFNRLGGDNESGGHVDAIREGTEIINGLKQAYRMDEAVIQFGLQVFKTVTMANFCQGRRITIVAVCSLYAAARAMKAEQYNPDYRNYQCKVMLIDFADHLGLNVFQLGKTFKTMLEKMCLLTIPMIVPEDLMFRFAVKLDFGLETKAVAMTAIKLARRMEQDWMLTGRRPAGICGACILMAARVHNFRRTVEEVVYVVKVTHGTIQKRLDEFKETSSSKMTVEDFMNNEAPTSSHDPPAFYRQTEEYKKTRKTRKRKLGQGTRNLGDDEENEDDREDSQGSDRERSTSSSSTPGPTSQPQLDADGFAIPALPANKRARTDNGGLSTPASTGPTASPTPSLQGQVPAAPVIPTEPAVPIEPSLLNQGATDGLEDLEHLAINLGDVELPEPMPETTDTTAPPSEDDAEIEADIQQTMTNFMDLPATREQVSELVASRLRDDPNARKPIEAHFNDPNSETHRLHFEIARYQADLVAQTVATSVPDRNVSMDVHIGEDEFADDEEVTGCELSPEEIAIKSKIWYNENKDWLIRQIEKQQKKREEEKRPKIKRIRKKVDKIGAGQKEPMASSHEAAIAALERRTGRTRGGETKSKKINYKAIQEMMDREDGSVPSSASTSRATSVAPPRARRAGSALLAASVANSRASSRASSAVSVGGDSDYASNVGGPADVGNALLSQMDDGDYDDGDGDVDMGYGDEDGDGY